MLPTGSLLSRLKLVRTRTYCAGAIFLFAWTAAAAQSPELIPRTILFSNPEHDQGPFSPDGNPLGYPAPWEQGVPNV